MNAAKFTLTSTILAAALGLALGLAAAPSGSSACDTGTKHKTGAPCGGGGGDGEDPIVYTAKLTMGAFEFMCFDPSGPGSDPDLCALNTVEVTPNNREIELRSNTDLDMVRPDFPSDEFDTWNDVFNACAELLDLLGLDSVEGFFVANDEWRIAQAGGVRVIFRDIELQDLELQGAEVRVQLIGEVFDFSIVPFLPEPGGTSVFELVDFEITGTPVRGTGAIQSCRGSDGRGELMVPSTLEITASE